MKIFSFIVCGLLVLSPEPALALPEPALALIQDSTAVTPVKLQQIETFDDLPVGTIIPWPSNKALPGQDKGSQKWLLCAGGPVPGGSKFELLRAIIGERLPRYNEAVEDARFGVFLRGSRAPRLNVINLDTTEAHTHEQKPHTHEFNLEVARNELVGDTASAKYQDGKRGQGGYENNPALYVGSPWTDMSKRGITPEDVMNEIRNQPSDFSEAFEDHDGWGPEKPTPDSSFYQVRDEWHLKSIAGDYEPRDTHLDLSEMSYTTRASVEGWGTASSKPHRVRTGKTEHHDCSTDKDGKTTCHDWTEWFYATVYCGGVEAFPSGTVDIQHVDAYNPEFKLRTHGAEDFMGSRVDKENDWVAGWGVFGVEDTMDESDLKGVRLTNRKVVGRLHKDGGDDSSYGFDLRSPGATDPTDSQETMPAHTTVRYIIKALP